MQASRDSSTVVFLWIYWNFLITSASWTKGCKQIHEIKQNRFLHVMFFSWVFNESVKICLLGVRLGTRHQIQVFQGFSWYFLSFQLFYYSWGNFLHSLSGDNNVVPFHLWWRETVLKREKVSKYFVQDIILKNICERLLLMV